MGDIAKWGILAAAAAIIIGLIVAFPFMNFIDSGVYTQGIATLVTVVGNGFTFARGLVNNFLSPWARSALTALMIWLVGKWILTYSVKLIIWVYHFLFK